MPPSDAHEAALILACSKSEMSNKLMGLVHPSDEQFPARTSFAYFVSYNAGKVEEAAVVHLRFSTF